MEKLYLLLLSPLDAPVQQVFWCLASSTQISNKHENTAADDSHRGAGTIDDFVRVYTEQFQDRDIVAIISGQYLTYTNVALTVKNQKQMLQALPFLVEEQVIGNIEDMHIAIPAKISGDSIRIAIIEKEIVDKLKAIFLHYKLSVNEIFGLPDLLSCSSDELKILLSEEFCLVKSNKDCFQCEHANLETMLALVSFDDISSITISLNELNKNSLSLAKKIKNNFGNDLLKIKSAVFTENMLDHIIRTADISTLNSLNILQGDFLSANSKNKKIQQFLPLAWVAVLCLSLQIAFNIASGFYFKRLSDQTNQNAATLYLQLFPEDKKIVNLSAQLSAKTNSSALDLNESRFPIVFASIVSATNALGAAKDIKIKQFRYDEDSGELKIGLDTNSISSLDKLKNKLQESNFVVEIISANEDAGTIKATLSIKMV